MEFVPRGSLYSILQAHPNSLSWKQKMSFCSDVSRGMQLLVGVLAITTFCAEVSVLNLITPSILRHRQEYIETLSLKTCKSPFLFYSFPACLITELFRLVTNNWRVKIADFGTAKLIDSSFEEPKQPFASETYHSYGMTSQTGTLLYMAPELLNSTNYGPEGTF